MTGPGLRFDSREGRWVLIAAVGGSGIAFLDATVVNIALPAIAADLGSGLSGLQWILDGYLVTLSSLLLLGGSLGDLYGRRRLFVTGLAGFSAASLLCGLAPNTAALVVARAAQGAAGALLVPGSLALISASFRPEDRARAVGAWSGLAGAVSALGPFAGGFLIDAFSWRLIFLVNLPLAAATAWVALRHVPESRDPGPSAAGSRPRPDVPGAVAASVGLAGVAYASIGAPSGLGPAEIAAAITGVGALIAFVLIERARPDPMLPLDIFGSRQFSGANATTLAVYGGFGGALFLLMLELQNVLGYRALQAGASLLPVTALMLFLSPRVGALAQRIGPRLPMTIGPLVVAAGLLLFGRLRPGASYLGDVLPAAVVFGVGLALTVAPLTTAVLAAVDERHLGVASGVNNAVARLAGLLAVALLPAVAGLEGASSPAVFSAGFARAMTISAVVCAAGGLIAFATVRRSTPVEVLTPAGVHHPCHDACVARRAPAA